MEADGIVLMQRENGILSKELGSYSLESGIELVYKAYVEDEIVYLYLTTPNDVSDEEYNDIFDEYVPVEFEDTDIESAEVEDEFNPVWLYKTGFIEDDSQMEALLNDIVLAHKAELERVFEQL